MDNLPQDQHCCEKNLTERLNACVKAGNGHFDYSRIA